MGIPVFCLRASFRLTHLRVLLTRTFLWPPPFLPHEGRFIIAWLTCKRKWTIYINDLSTPASQNPKPLRVSLLGLHTKGFTLRLQIEVVERNIRLLTIFDSLKLEILPNWKSGVEVKMQVWKHRLLIISGLVDWCVKQKVLDIYILLWHTVIISSKCAMWVASLYSCRDFLGQVWWIHQTQNIQSPDFLCFGASQWLCHRNLQSLNFTKKTSSHPLPSLVSHPNHAGLNSTNLCMAAWIPN